MTAVSGLLRIGEATPTLRSIGARQRGSVYFYYMIMFGMIAAGGVCGNILARYVGHFDIEAATIFGTTAGALAYVFVARRLTTARFRSRMVEKGHPPLLQLEVEITPDAIRYKVGDIRHTAPWSAVSELFESRGYWIFLVQSSPFFAPKRFFESLPAEKAFLRAALERMTEDARGRSQEAVAFANAA